MSKSCLKLNARSSLLSAGCLAGFAFATSVACATQTTCQDGALKADEFRATTFERPWQDLSASVSRSAVDGAAELRLDRNRTDQEIVGFGTALSEIGWDALGAVSTADRKAFLDELFAADGGGFTAVRLPIGSSDFARSYYSYDDHPGDFGMEKFSVERDESGLLPFVREVQSRVPAGTLKIWASPWTPPAWLKTNGHYASRPTEYNDLPKEKTVWEGETGFIMDDAHLKAYALYFRKYVDAYRAKGIPIWMVMPQNEPNSSMPYSSCCWPTWALVKFVGGYLGPALEGSGTEIFFGTVERGTMDLVNQPLNDPAASRYVKGFGFQWAGKAAIVPAHKRYPGAYLMQSEQECGDGRNDWGFAWHTWGLMRHYISNGARLYMYWNVALFDGEASPWGWHQNSLVVVDRAKGKGRLSADYYVLKQLSHFVKRGAKRLLSDEAFDGLAFVNPDGSVTVIFGNGEKTAKTVNVRLGETIRAVTLPPESVSTLLTTDFWPNNQDTRKGNGNSEDG